MGFGGLVHGRTGMFKISKSYPHQNGLEICGEDTNFDRRSWERGREIHCIFPFGPERDGVAHNPTDTRRHRPRICALPHTQSPMICSITRMPTQYEIEEGQKKKKSERERGRIESKLFRREEKNILSMKPREKARQSPICNFFLPYVLYICICICICIYKRSPFCEL